MFAQVPQQEVPLLPAPPKSVLPLPSTQPVAVQRHAGSKLVPARAPVPQAEEVAYTHPSESTVGEEDLD